MSETPSTMVPLGTRAPDFALVNAVDGRVVRRQDFAGKPLLVMFICNHCPFVVHVRSQFGALEQDYAGRVQIVAINANDIERYPQDGPGPMKALAQELGWGFPYLFDATQEVAKAYRAACTPDFQLFDASHELFYRGQLDSSRPSLPIPVTGKDLRAALDALLRGHPAPEPQIPSIGCNIKWKPGNEPSYFR